MAAEQLIKVAAPVVLGLTVAWGLSSTLREARRVKREEGSRNRVLVTGGAGFIGSHTVLLLLQAQWEVVVIDSLKNSSKESLRRVAKMAGAPDRLTFIHADLLDKDGLERVFNDHGGFKAIIHFAGYKAVGESMEKPLMYYENNLTGTLNLLDVMKRHGTDTLVFSSSSTVYGNNAPSPVTEESPIGRNITNAYGQSKYMGEKILESFQRSPGGSHCKIVVLRYFNPIGAHESGWIGEDPTGIPNNLMPYIAQVAVGRRSELTVFGGDYDTKDGTCVRDYIHVVDVAEGHLAALDHADAQQGGGFMVFNLGTGVGYSVLDMVKAMEKATAQTIKYVVGDRRPGDVAQVFCDPSKARKLLGWSAKRDLDAMCRDLWRWQQENPEGYSVEDAPVPAYLKEAAVDSRINVTDGVNI